MFVHPCDDVHCITVRPCVMMYMGMPRRFLRYFEAYSPGEAYAKTFAYALICIPVRRKDLKTPDTVVHKRTLARTNDHTTVLRRISFWPPSGRGVAEQKSIWNQQAVEWIEKVGEI